MTDKEIREYYDRVEPLTDEEAEEIYRRVTPKLMKAIEAEERKGIRKFLSPRR